MYDNLQITWAIAVRKAQNGMYKIFYNIDLFYDLRHGVIF